MTDAPAVFRSDIIAMITTAVVEWNTAGRGDSQEALTALAEQIEALMRTRLADAIEAEWRARLHTPAPPLVMKMLLDTSQWIRGGIVITAIGASSPVEATFRAVRRRSRDLAQLAPTVARRMLERLGVPAV